MATNRYKGVHTVSWNGVTITGVKSITTDYNNGLVFDQSDNEIYDTWAAVGKYELTGSIEFSSIDAYNTISTASTHLGNMTGGSLIFTQTAVTYEQSDVTHTITNTILENVGGNANDASTVASYSLGWRALVPDGSTWPHTES